MDHLGSVVGEKAFDRRRYRTIIACASRRTTTPRHHRVTARRRPSIASYLAAVLLTAAREAEGRLVDQGRAAVANKAVGRARLKSVKALMINYTYYAQLRKITVNGGRTPQKSWD